jgi:hypothetical protein
MVEAQDFMKNPNAAKKKKSPHTKLSMHGENRPLITDNQSSLRNKWLKFNASGKTRNLVKKKRKITSHQTINAHGEPIASYK